MRYFVYLGDQIRETLRMLGKVLHKEKRADEIIAYFNAVEEGLKGRVAAVPDAGKPRVYVCGISYNGAHGADGTDPNYLAFTLLNARNVASGIGEVSQTGYAKVAKEQIIWNIRIPQALTAVVAGVNFESRSDPVLMNISVGVARGEILAILGPNGVGKSTLLKCMNMILQPKTGTILLEEKDLSRMPGSEIARYVGGVCCAEE